MVRLDSTSALILLGFGAEMDDREGDYIVGPLVHDTKVNQDDEQAIYVVGQWNMFEADKAAAKMDWIRACLYRLHATCSS